MSSVPLLRPLTIGEILDRALRIYRSHFGLLLSICLAALAPVTILQVISQLLWNTTALVDLIQSAFVQLLVSGALVAAIAKAYLSQPPTMGEAYRTASEHYGSAWGANFLMGLAIIAPVFAVSCAATMLRMGEGIWLVLLLIVPLAVFLGTRWSLLLPSILLEDLGSQAGMRRSWDLTEGSFWKVFGTSFLASLLIIVLATLPQLVIAYGLEMLLPNVPIVAVVETVLTQLGIMLTLPVSVGVSVVLYYDLRVRKEAFDLALQAQEAPVS